MSTDWSGKKYFYIEESGESIDIVFAHLDRRTFELKYFLRKHSGFDGIGGFCDLLINREGYAPSMPQLAIRKDPTFFEKVGLVKKYIQRLGAAEHPWRPGVDFETTGIGD